jgi:hypothetical protein
MAGTSKTTKDATGFSSGCICGLDTLGPVEAERWTPGNAGHLSYCPASRAPRVADTATEQGFIKGQSVAVIDNHGHVKYAGTVDYTYPDGRTVAVRRDGHRFSCVLPVHAVIGL